jgi:hypothetical protein
MLSKKSTRIHTNTAAEAVLPTGRKFWPQNAKVALENLSGRENPRPNFTQISSKKMAEKGAKFLKCAFHLKSCDNLQN